MKLNVVTLPVAIGIIVIALVGTYVLVVTPLLQPKPRVCIGGSCFHATVADTPAARERGLMHVPSLSPDEGMLFIFAQTGIYPFWMKNTLISLDMIWINESREIVFIKHDAQPCGEYACNSISPPREARYVLEVNAGTAQRLGWEVGDTVTMYTK